MLPNRRAYNRGEWGGGGGALTRDFMVTIQGSLVLTGWQEWSHVTFGVLQFAGNEEKHQS